MRWTVGPHPPAVYWRRRAIVAASAAAVAVLGWLAVHGLAAPAQSKPGTPPTGLGGR